MAGETVYVDCDDVPLGGAHVVEVNAGLRIAVFHSESGYHVINDRCPHAGGSLAEGPFDGRVVTCPLHRFQVDVTTGRGTTTPIVKVRTYEFERDGDRLKITI